MEGVASQLQTYYFTIYNTDFKMELVSLSAKAVSNISSDFFRVNIKRDVKRYSRIVLKTLGTTAVSIYIDHTVYVKEQQRLQSDLMKVYYKGHLSRWKTNNAKDMYQNISYILLHNGNQGPVV